MIAEQLLPDLRGFALKDNVLFIRPIGHTLRAVCVGHSSDPTSFYVEVFLQPLFIPFPVIAFMVGWLGLWAIPT
jgi:hypothetical protein